MFVHEKNLETKITNNYNGMANELKSFFNDVYLDVKSQMLSLNFEEYPESFLVAANIIDDYLQKIDDFSNAYKITSQSKFRSTFLEEITVYLTLKILKKNDINLGIYNKNIYAGIHLNNQLDVEVLTKDVDFCIGRSVEMIINKKLNRIIVPAIAVEIKTYLDGTMFNEVMFSSGNLKNATPTVKTYVLMEFNQTADQKIITARGRNDVDEMFVLKKDKNSKIDSSVLSDFYHEILMSISGISETKSIFTPGRLLRPNL